MSNNVLCFNLWVWNESSKLPFYWNKNNSTVSGFDPSNGDLITKIDVVILDEFLLKNKIKISKINFIKIDVEWYEMNVLKGMRKTLSNKLFQADIICEILNHEALFKIKDFLWSFWYEGEIIDEDRNFLFKRIN